MPATDESREMRCVTARSVAVGLLVVAAINYWVAYAEYVVRASRMNVSHFPMALFIVLAALALGLNAALRSVGSQWGLRQGELVTVVAMGLVGAVAPASGVTGFLLGNIGTPFYFASVENQWGQYLHRWIPGWLAPRDELGALTWFFEGLPEGQRAPWGVWVAPLVWWAALIGALAWLCACLSALLRRRWSEEERLSYPLLEPVRELAQEPSGGAAGLLWSRLLMVGAAVPLAVMGLELVAFFSPGFPSLGLYRARYLHFIQGFPPIIGGDHFVARAFQVDLDQANDMPLVVDSEDFLRHRLPTPSHRPVGIRRCPAKSRTEYSKPLLDRQRTVGSEGNPTSAGRMG